MTNPDFRIIVLDRTNMNVVYLLVKGVVMREVVTGLIRTLGDRLEQNF